MATMITGGKRKKVIIALAVLVFLLSVFLIYSQTVTLSDLRQAVEEEEQAVDLARLNLTRLINHRNNAAEYEHRLIYARQMIPGQAGEEAVLRYLYRLNEQYDLRTIEIRFDNRTDGETYTAMPLSLTIEGSYQNVRAFLQHLFAGERAFRVDTFRMNRADDQNNNLRVAMTAVTFYNPLD